MTGGAPDAPRVCHVDTSALIGRHVFEPGSDAFDESCLQRDIDAVVRPLVMTEFSIALRRVERLGGLSWKDVATVRQRWSDDVAPGGWRVVALAPARFGSARTSIEDAERPMATLDAPRLARALAHGLSHFASADRQLAAAARPSQPHVHVF